MSLGLLIVLSLYTNISPTVVSNIVSIVLVPFKQALEVLLNEDVISCRMLK